MYRRGGRKRKEVPVDGEHARYGQKKNNTHTHTHDKEAEQEEGGPSLLAKGDALFDGRRLVLLLLLLLLFGKMIVGLCGGDVVPSIEHQDGLERQR